jgi:hypothetical protein
MVANRQKTPLHRIVEVHRELARLVTELDSVELHHAAAHVSTALDIMRADYPELLTTR